MKTLVALSVMFAAAAAIADDPSKMDPEKSAEVKFEALDRNKDQSLSKAEAREDASLVAQFETLDVNADGYISKREYVSQMAQPPSSKEPYN